MRRRVLWNAICIPHDPAARKSSPGDASNAHQVITREAKTNEFRKKSNCAHVADL
jgi:hypothetical protein